jgi:hypothetical protein
MSFGRIQGSGISKAAHMVAMAALDGVSRAATGSGWYPKNPRLFEEHFSTPNFVEFLER